MRPWGVPDPVVFPVPPNLEQVRRILGVKRGGREREDRGRFSAGGRPAEVRVWGRVRRRRRGRGGGGRGAQTRERGRGGRGVPCLPIRPAAPPPPPRPCRPIRRPR